MAGIDICLCLIQARIASARPRAHAETRANACVRHFSEVRVGVEELQDHVYTPCLSHAVPMCTLCIGELCVGVKELEDHGCTVDGRNGCVNSNLKVGSEKGNRQGVQCKYIWHPALT